MRRFAINSLLLLLIVVLFSINFPGSQGNASVGLKMRDIALGIYSGNGAAGLQETRLIEGKLDHPFDILHFYTGFNQEFEVFERENLNQISDKRCQILISWAPGIESGILYKEIAKGSVDPYLHRWAKGVKKLENPVLIRFSYEMNMKNMGWFAGGQNGSPEDFVAAWRHIHDIFVAEGALQAQWVWCPHADMQSPQYTDALLYYPGNDVVDWIGMDGYYWGGMDGNEKNAFDRIFEPVYEQLKPFGKPMMIAEIGGAGDLATVQNWHKATLEKLMAEYTQIKAIVYFNADFSNKGEKDWRLSIYNNQVLQEIKPYLKNMTKPY